MKGFLLANKNGNLDDKCPVKINDYSLQVFKKPINFGAQTN